MTISLKYAYPLKSYSALRLKNSSPFSSTYGFVGRSMVPSGLNSLSDSVLNCHDLSIVLSYKSV